MNNYIVYKHTTPNNKVYIGITQQEPKKRWKSNGIGYKNNSYFYKAITKYGWDNIKHEILFNGLEELDAKNKEIELIKYYNSTNPNNGYNITPGGDGTKGYHHKELSKQKMSKAKKGIHLINSGSFKKGQIPYNVKKVKCIETGKIWGTLTEAQIEMGVSNSYLSQVCKGKRKTCKGYHFAYVE